MTVLSFYILNGAITLDQRGFSDFWGRRINLAGDPARYVAQVQVSSVSEASAWAAIRSLSETVLGFLPDQHGHVRAADRADRYITEEQSPDQMP